MGQRVTGTLDAIVKRLAEQTHDKPGDPKPAGRSQDRRTIAQALLPRYTVQSEDVIHKAALGAFEGAIGKVDR